MSNIIKMLSVNTDYRLVITDTDAIAKRELKNFTGNKGIRSFLTHLITNCTLLFAVNDVNTKISFSFRFTDGNNVFCQITDSKFRLEYSENLQTFDGAIADLLDLKSIVSITTGDWKTGIHTGTIEAFMDSADMLLSYFTIQSEQLPSHFIIAGNNTSRGVLMQPLPFADETSISKSNDELIYLSKELEQKSWELVPELYSHLAHVTAQKSIE